MTRTDMSAGPAPHSLTESDLELFDAMQDDPRGPWTEIGRRVGVSPSTVRRQWQRISSQRDAWIVTYPGKGAGVFLSIVEVECTAGAVPQVCAAVRLLPAVLNVYETNGDVDLLLETVTLDVRQLRSVLHAVAQAPGVIRVRSSTGSTIYREASRWRTGALPRTSSAGSEEAAAPNPAQLDRALTVLRELERDGRASPAHLAGVLGMSETHARRYVKALLRQKVLVQRVDMAPGVSEWPHSLALHMSAPAGELAATAAAISGMPGTRLCTATAGGRHNLYAVIWMHGVHEAVEVEARITGSLTVEVLHRSLILHAHKRMGHLIDEHGRDAGLVPWQPPGADGAAAVAEDPAPPSP
ncbi:AsnC family transcriptional regulator [Brevibacterium sp.]|uniref:Lrp/AsnC family transcriptional regulator n=1 Tax=Brevibacterium sp. TaxID=1701 RepID=UPI0025B7BA1D|nr:AsnC family transcriptional regulator [Brevibacterium sp.]